MSTLDTKKSVGLDTSPPKLVKMAAIVFCQKKNISKGTFPDDAKIAMVSLLDNGITEKNISNFRSDSFFTFSKIYEKFTKKLLDTATSKYLSHFISAYR